MFTIKDIRDMFNDTEEGYIEIARKVSVPLEKIIEYCHDYDDLLYILDDELCEEWIPKYDCSYRLIGFKGGFYDAVLEFIVDVVIAREDFENEYGSKGEQNNEK